MTLVRHDYTWRQRDEYFNNEMFIKQVESALEIFDRKFPGSTGLFLFDNATQRMVLPDGTAKGMKLVLQERGIDVKGMNAKKMRQKLNEFPDFTNQMTILEELVRSKGHTCMYLPKYHYELNSIERNWCRAKKISCQYVNGRVALFG